MDKEFENVKTSKLISGPILAFHRPYLDNSECVFFGGFIRPPHK